MRVLVVDQDSASNLAITRSLRDLYTVDCVTNKADCLDLLRSNSFEVIVATERLEDGSGLELLGQIAKKWPSVLRIFAADRQRLQLLRGRLGPFELFQTLAYPIEVEKLLASLQKAAGGQSSNSQEVELPREVPAAPDESPGAAESAAQAPIALSALNEPLNLEQSDEYSEPRFARAGREEPVQASSSGRAASVRAAPRARRAEATAPENDLAAKFPGSGTFGPRHVAGGASGRSSRSGGERSATSKALPVRFPPLDRSPAERTPPLERVTPLESARARSAGDDLSDASALARAARSHYESSSEELDTKRLTMLIGGGVAVAAVVLFLGFKMFGSKGEAPKPAAPPVVSHAPEYPPEVTQLGKGGVSGRGAGVSSSPVLKRNGPKGGVMAPAAAKSDLTQSVKNDTGASASSGRAASAAPFTSTTRGSTAETIATPVGAHNEVPASADAGNVSTAGAGVGSTTAGAIVGSTAAGASGAPAIASTGAALGASAAGTSGVGGSSVASGSPAVGGSPAAGSSPVTPTASEGTSTTATPGTAAPASTQATHTATDGANTPPSASPRGAGEPPPVIQEAKLIRRVNPDYPSAARKDGTVGSVDLEVTVSPQGAVEKISVLQATPPDVFDKAAVAAVRKWKYDPRFVDGLPSQAHMKVHLEFAPDK